MRALVLAIAPIPVVAISMAVADWARTDPVVYSARNEVRIADDEAAADGNSLNSEPWEASALLTKQMCKERAEMWRTRLGSDCNVIVRAPFVIAGNLPKRELQYWCRETVEPASNALATTYLVQLPDEPISVLLFSAEESYRSYSQRLFGQERVSIYGYYKPAFRVLTINMATGCGTIVHELTHALLDFDFPNSPLWFNEGIASLYEQCEFIEPSESDADRQYAMRGLDNWRLPVLKQAIRQSRLGSIQSLILKADLHGPDEAVHYAHARYLCLFLQNCGALEDFYAALRTQYEQKPAQHAQNKNSSVEILLALLPDDNIEALDERFRKWVLRL